jgi:hypothetical protein
MYLIKKLYHPENFQGKYKKTNYFEGWYFKNIDKKRENVLAVIPGISLDTERLDNHAFIQVLDAKNCKVSYIRYNISEFKFDNNKFQIQIGDNFFSRKEMRLNIEDDNINILGHLSFSNIIRYPKTLTHPGIMGPYSFVPFMECYHGIINIHHDISGQLNISEKEIDFSHGYGYIEKDWGKSFPESWIWFQSNHFGLDDVTIMFSAAKIPWIGRSFLGLISFIRIKDKIFHFSTYTRAKISKLDYKDNNLRVALEDKKYRLEMHVTNSKGGILKAPQNGLMHREILESIDATIGVKFSYINGKIIYQGEGKNTGFEIVNEAEALDSLWKMKK